MPIMTRTQAQAARRQELQAAVDAAAACQGTDPEDWFRQEGEPRRQWSARRPELTAFCRACPVMEACQELALRVGDGDDHDDYMVRGGLSGRQLARTAVRQEKRLTAAAKADETAACEQRRINTVAQQLHRLLRVTPNPARGEAHNAHIRELADQLQRLRAARRARTGWRRAA